MFDCLYQEKKRSAFDVGVLVLSQKTFKSFGGKNLCRFKPDLALQKSRYFLILCYTSTESKKILSLLAGKICAGLKRILPVKSQDIFLILC